MTTSSHHTLLTTPTTHGIGPLRLRLSDDASTDRVDGAWWPRSRDLRREAADLVDHFPAARGRIDRLLFSRPDWDASSENGRGVRSIRAARGLVKVGSFPSDDTHLMILTMASGPRLKLLVIPSDTPEDEGWRRLDAAARASSAPDSSAPDSPTWPDGVIDGGRWDDESPSA